MHSATVIPALTSSNPGLPAQAPMRYTDYMILYSENDRVEAVVDGAPPGPNGRLFIVEPRRPTKVPWEAGRFILEHLAYTGVVRVLEREKVDDLGNVVGLEYDVATARGESEIASAEADEYRFRQYVSDTMDDYVARKDGKSKVPPPPPPSILKIIQRRGYKLIDYGIKPVGFEDPLDVERRNLKDDNTTLKSQVAELQAQLGLLLKMSQGNPPQPQPAPAPEPSDPETPQPQVRRRRDRTGS